MRWGAVSRFGTRRAPTGLRPAGLRVLTYERRILWFYGQALAREDIRVDV